MSLRVYQQDGVTQIVHEFKHGRKRVLLVMPTGAGKTVVFCYMVKGAVAKGRRAIIVVRGRKLVDQASQRLFREHVEHGVMMAGHWNYRPHLPVQVCSIDTLIARGLTPAADLIILDEAHLATSEGYREFLEKYPDAFMVPVTATPYCDGGLRHVADTIVRPITMQTLIDQGHLVPFRYFAPSEPDLDGVKISRSTKDYDSKQLEERMVAGNLTGQVVEHWKKIAQDRPTILFAVNIHHSKLMAEKFQNEGIRAEHCDADTPDKERERIIRRLEKREIQVVCNVGILCTGVDIPSLGAIIMARATKSYNLYIQQAGRGTRTAPGKRDCILLDHAGNIRRHGFPTMEPEVDLDGRITGETGALESKICKVCFAVYRGKECPDCGAPTPPEVKKEIVETDEELHEIQVSAKTPVEQWLEYLEQQRTKTGRKNGWQYWKLLEKFSIEECKPYLPKWFIFRYESKTSDNPFAGAPFSGGGM